MKRNASHMQPRPDLIDKQSADGIEVYQLTTEAGMSCSHIYMEAQVVTTDSRRLILHRSATPHGGRQDDPEHRYLLCDLDNGGALSPLTDECGVTGPALSPDDQWLYYFHDQTRLNGGRLTLKRVRLDGTDRESLIVLDRPAEGAVRQISLMYPLSTISSDGRRIAISGFLGDGHREPPPWGLLVFDLDSEAVRLVLEGPSWCNIHPQYSRCRETGAAHDLLVQENHGNLCDAAGVKSRGVSGPGCDIHVIRDDGTQFRDLAWGRDGREFCEGHQCWRGRGTTAITSAGVSDPRGDHVLIEGAPAPHDGHLGAATANGRRNILSSGFNAPRFHHFATDIAGMRLITDFTPESSATTELYLAEFGEPLAEPLHKWRRILNTGTPKNTSLAHAHPFLSSDGTTAFFNSTESGILQAYMIRGLDRDAAGGVALPHA